MALTGIKGLLTILLLLAILISMQYASSTFYHFNPPQPFTGKHWYNPYDSIGDLKLKANFHAHSCAWSSVTYGVNSSEEMYKAYKQNGYDVAALSNYHKTDTCGRATDELYIPVYEHGFNIFKAHCLAINPKQVSYYDYFLYQSTSQQQKVIERIKENGGIVALAHPEFSHGRQMRDMRNLVHYDLIEVLNHYRVSDEHWDEALSSGRLAYLIANDDSHSLDKSAMFRMWTMVYPKKRTKKAILNALTHGSAYGVQTDFNICQNDLEYCRLSGDTLRVKMKIRADAISFVGQNGKIKSRIEHADSASYLLEPSDTYIRIVAKNSESAIYLNPVVRYQDHIPFNSVVVPKVKTLQTYLFRASMILWILFLFRLLWKVWVRRKISFSKRPIPSLL